MLAVLRGRPSVHLRQSGPEATYTHDMRLDRMTGRIEAIGDSLDTEVETSARLVEERG
jgi:hypothetical protein